MINLNTRFVKLFVPFLIFVVGGSVGLREFTQLRYQYSRVTKAEILEEFKKAGIEPCDPSETTLEAHYDRVKKELDIDHWENVRIPRPWDEEEEAKKVIS